MGMVVLGIGCISCGYGCGYGCAGYRLVGWGEIMNGEEEGIPP